MNIPRNIQLEREKKILYSDILIRIYKKARTHITTIIRRGVFMNNIIIKKKRKVECKIFKSLIKNKKNKNYYAILSIKLFISFILRTFHYSFKNKCILNALKSII